MPERPYEIFDVFTQERLAGNPLAVVHDAKGLDGEAMQRIAREFNLSETAFLFPPENALHTAQVRIFTPDYEMPFAGHPTVGSAIALAEREYGEGATRILVLEEKVGPVRCVVSRNGAASFAEFDLPKPPEPLPLAADAASIGAALGLGPHEIGFENHRVDLWSAGVPYVTIPVAGLEAAAKARLDNAAWAELAPRKENGALASAYVYCRETLGHDSNFHVRMFVPGNPSYEDPATGSAAAAFAGAIARFDAPVDGVSRFWIEQGIEMGRPSRIRLEIDLEQGRITAGRIGGHAVRTASGVLFV